MKVFISILILSLIYLSCANAEQKQASKLDDAQCTEAFHKSAVTPEAAAEAAKREAKRESEIYSSKVKSINSSFEM